ncbi:methyl-accepting chemotaxis protein, partial [Mobiluncus mulieris]
MVQSTADDIIVSRKKKRNISIKTRLILMAAIALALMLIINLVSFNGLRTIQEDQITSGNYTKVYEKLTDAIEYVALLEGYQETAARYSLLRDNAKTPEEAAAIQKKSDDDDDAWKELVAKTQETIDSISSMVQTPSDKEAVQKITAAWTEYKPTHDLLLDLSHDPAPAATARMNELLGKDVWDKYQATRTVLDEFDTFEEKTLAELRNKSVSLSATVMVITWLAFLAAVVVLSLVAVFSIKHIQKSITLIMEGVGALRDGDLSQRLQPLSTDELGKTAVALNEANETL